MGGSGVDFNIESLDRLRVRSGVIGMRSAFDRFECGIKIM
jgi:hypothetical protein